MQISAELLSQKMKENAMYSTYIVRMYSAYMAADFFLNNFFQIDNEIINYKRRKQYEKLK